MRQQQAEQDATEDRITSLRVRGESHGFLLDHGGGAIDPARLEAETAIILPKEAWDENSGLGVPARPGIAAGHERPGSKPSSNWSSIQRSVKRSIDIVLGGIFALALLPFVAVIAGIIWMVDGKPIIFSQERIGMNGKLFNCLKFRTMRIDAQERLDAVLAQDETAAREWVTTQKIRNDPRATRLGRFLRRSSIDEIPQFLNVIRGDMSLVGPRPILPTEAWRFGRYIEAYKSVQPGLTGPWQVNGRNNLSYRQRVAVDTNYARNFSLWRDLMILCRTPFAILRSEKWD
ncbi:sugar transferase [Altererythrobacter sp. MF3-039]|uniref:sugar transferase n=1 Tax=Altererythrobacter sp. MF3-039 TaxID=3252901 RepID=UPI00390CB6FE